MEVIDVSPRTIDEGNVMTSFNQSSISQSNTLQGQSYIPSLNLKGPHDPVYFSTISPEESERQLQSASVPNETNQRDSNDIQVLYSRAQLPIFLQNSERIPEKEVEDRFSRLQKAAKPPLTKIHEYKAFMEASTSLKDRLFELIHKMKTSIQILERTTSILRDPGFRNTSILQCWIWIFEEALAITSSPENDKAAWKDEVSKLMKDIVSAYESVCNITQRLQLSYDKLKKKFENLSKKSKRKLQKNVGGAQEFWQKNEKDRLKKDLEFRQIDWIPPIQLKPDTKILKVRWAVDGITLKMDGRDQWLKFRSIAAFQDKRTLIQIFKTGLKDTWRKVSGTLLATEKFTFSKQHASIEATLAKLFRILKLETKFEYVPKEEVMMLNSTLTNLAIFNAIQPLLDSLKERTTKNLELVMELSNRQSDILLGKGKRVPLGRWAELMFELEVHSTIENIFTRNSTKTPAADNEVAKTEVEEQLVEILLKNDNYALSTPNPEEDLRETETRLVVQADPTLESVFDTCYVFTDIRSEYETALASILRHRKFQESHLELCSDSVRKFYQSVQEMEMTLTDASFTLINAKEYLLHNNSDPHLRIPTTTWIGLICKLLNIWDTRDLSPHLKESFKKFAQQFLTTSENLELSIRQLMAFLVKQKQCMEQLHRYFKSFSGYQYHGMKKLWFSPEENYQNHSKGFNSGRKNPYNESVSLRFTDFDMEVTVSSKSSSKFKSFNFNEAPNNIKMELVCKPFHHIMRTMNKAMLNITRTHASLKSNLDINGIREVLIPSYKIFVPYYNALEMAVITNLVKGLEAKISQLIENTLSLDGKIGNISEMVKFVHLQMAMKKLISDKLSRLEMKEIQGFEDLIGEIPDLIEVSDIIAREEYKRLIAQRVKNLEMKSLAIEESLKETRNQKVRKRKVLKMSLHVKLNPKLLKPDTYIKNLHSWITGFHKHMSEKLTLSLAALISPKVSQCKVSGFGNLDKPLGFVEGLSFLLRESVKNLKPQGSSRRDDSISIMKSNLTSIADAIVKLETVSRTVGPVLRKLTYSILSYKSKLPQDMRFLDNAVEGLAREPDVFQVILEIWKKDNIERGRLDDKHSRELELHWDSTNKYVVLARSSNSVEPNPWVEIATMSPSSQVKAISVLSDSCCNAFNQACNYMTESEKDVKKGKNFLKQAWNRLRADEKSSFLRPDSVYAILKQFEYSINLSTLVYEAITNITENMKAVLTIGMIHLQTLTSKNNKAVLNRQRKYPESMILNVIIHAPDDIDLWLKVDTSIDENASGDHISVIEIKAAVDMKPSASSINIIDDQSSQQSSSEKVSLAKVFSLDKKSTSKDDIYTAISKANEVVSSILQQMCTILRLPNTSLTTEVRVDHYLGIVILLVHSVLELYFFKDASDVQRREVLNQCNRLTTRLDNSTLSKVIDDLHLTLTKIQRSAESFEKILVQKFSHGGDTSFEEIPIYPPEDIEESPGALAEHFAVKMDCYAWEAVYKPEVGVVLKNDKTNESHTFMRFSLLKRIHIVVSVMKYIDQILILTVTNLQAVKKDFNMSKSVIKDQIKKVPSLIKKGIINDSNISEALDSVRRLKSTCDTSFTYLDQISALITEGNNIVRNIYSYLNIKFKLETPIPDDIIMRNYRSAMENKILGLEIEFEEFQRFPLSVQLPLTLSPIDFDI